jgi:hypothetical protein
MRKLTSFGLGFAVLSSLAAGFPCRAGAEDVAPLVAKVIRVSGGAQYSVGGQTWQALKVGTVLSPGTLVQTAKTKATVELQLGEAGGAQANIVRLLDDTAVEIKKLAAKGVGAERVEEIELDLRMGQILGAVRKFNDGSTYQIMLPTGAAGVRGDAMDSRGTVFLLKPSGELAVLAGKLAIAIASEKTVAQIVGADQKFDPATGQVAKLAADAPERKLWRF